MLFYFKNVFYCKRYAESYVILHLRMMNIFVTYWNIYHVFKMLLTFKKISPTFLCLISVAGELEYLGIS